MAPAQITVLVYYTGQLALVSHKIEMKAQTNGRPWTLSSGKQVSSVDSFQGEENDFVFIDVVTARQDFQQTGPADDADDSGEEKEVGVEGFKHSGKVTGHVKSPNRLCCALTRGRNCVVVVCQLTTLLSTVKASQTKSNAALGALAMDFLGRKLVFHDYANLDTSPAGELTRAKWDNVRHDQEMRQKKIDSLNLLNAQRLKVGRARVTKDEGQNAGPKLYRTQDRRTTRPNISGATADEAEAHDIQSKRTIDTEAGPIPLTVGPATQHAAKVGRKAAQANAKADKKAADDADSGRKGTVQPMSADPQGKGHGEGSVDKGKEKELPEDPKGTDEEPHEHDMETR